MRMNASTTFCPPIGDNGVTHSLCDYFNRHAWLNTNAIAVLDMFRCYFESCHIIFFTRKVIK